MPVQQVVYEPSLSSRGAPNNNTVSLGPTPESSLDSIYEAPMDPHAIFRTSVVSARGSQREKTKTGVSRYDFAQKVSSARDRLVTEVAARPGASSSTQPKGNSVAFARDMVGSLDPRTSVEQRQPSRHQNQQQRENNVLSGRSSTAPVLKEEASGSSHPSPEHSAFHPCGLNPYHGPPARLFDVPRLNIPHQEQTSEDVSRYQHNPQQYHISESQQDQGPSPSYSPEPQGYQPQPYQPRYQDQYNQPLSAASSSIQARPQPLTRSQTASNPNKRVDESTYQRSHTATGGWLKKKLTNQFVSKRLTI